MSELMKTRQKGPWAWQSTLTVALKTSPEQCQFLFEIQLQILQVDCCNVKDGQTSIDSPSTLVEYSSSFVSNVPHYLDHFRRTPPEHAVHKQPTGSESGAAFYRFLKIQSCTQKHGNAAFSSVFC